MELVYDVYKGSGPVIEKCREYFEQLIRDGEAVPEDWIWEYGSVYAHVRARKMKSPVVLKIEDCWLIFDTRGDYEKFVVDWIAEYGYILNKEIRRILRFVNYEQVLMDIMREGDLWYAVNSKMDRSAFDRLRKAHFLFPEEKESKKWF